VTEPATTTGNVPKVTSLAHYTNLAGLHGILESGQLWASNVAFLNDREELLHGVKCASRALSSILKDRKLEHWLDAIRKVVHQIEEGRLPNTYAVCFCEKSDLLSQWRGYPTLRQFRQPSPLDWEGVIVALREALSRLAAGDLDQLRPRSATRPPD
jgi:hypothetical protein